ncbi:hypothetical protein [Mastigocoleus sp. MO_188.B34]|uniref:hypothetical protein n=1 Tax=Mastigocoleus sp. MO_188.B34 TaxID=3036635 RepID=UPI002635C0D5|nr:hypothetical protein [Mastigocoleus sp. MO_188.B34]MDJ0697362.1 hypothetical protein [Mastigocoleus sp. MO_188.B34]
MYFRHLKFFFIFILGILLSACGEVEEKKVQNTNDLPSREPTTIVYEDLVVKNQSDYVLIPVGISPDENEQREGLFSRKSNKSKNIYNIIFYNKKTGNTSLLLNRQAIIKSFNFLEIDVPPKTEEEKKTSKIFWLYRLITTDTNQDGKLDDLDAIIGYVSDFTGKNLLQVTPANTQLANWFVLPEQGEVLIKLLNDSDKDLKFTDKDTINFIKVDLNKPKIGTNFINNELEQKIKSYSSQEE